MILNVSKFISNSQTGAKAVQGTQDAPASSSQLGLATPGTSHAPQRRFLPGCDLVSNICPCQCFRYSATMVENCIVTPHAPVFNIHVEGEPD